MTGKQQRRSQQERTAETSARLMEATIDLLYENGITRATTPEIARKAGVSRGALTHHFPTRDSIITSSIERMLALVNEDMARFGQNFAVNGGSSDEIVDYLWSVMSDRLFYVTLEYLPEARHNEEFKQQLVPVVREFHAGLDRIWTELADRTGVAPDLARNMMNGTMCFIRGMIAQTVLRDDPAYYEGLLTFWKQQVRQQFPIAKPSTRPQNGAAQ